MKKTMHLNSEIFNNNDFVIIKKHMRAGYESRLHWHDYFEFEIITSGRVEHMHNQNKYIACDGNAYLMSYYDFHSFKAITDTNLIVIHFNENILSDELSEFISLGIRRFNCVYNKSELKNIMALIKKIETENEQGLLFNRQIIANTLSELVINIIRKSDAGTETHMPQPIQEAVIYLLKHFLLRLQLVK